MTFSIKSILFVFLLSSLWFSAIGQELRYTGASFTGNDRTKESVLLREITFDIDSSYNKEDISEYLLTSKNRLMNLNLFNAVNASWQATDSSFSISFELVEKWYIWPIPSIEFSDRNFNVWQNLDFDPERTNYGLYLFNYNLFGSNHSMKLSFIYGYNKRFGLHYAIPFLSEKSNIGMHLTAAYKTQNEVWFNTVDDQLQFFKNGENNLIREGKLELGLQRRDQSFNLFGAQVGMDYTSISDSVIVEAKNLDYLLDGSNEQQIYYLAMSAERDQRDNRFLAMKGYYLRASLRAESYDFSETQNIKLQLRAQRFMEIADKLYAAFSVFGQLNSLKEAPYHNYKILGYENNLRGFEYYVVDGHAGMLSNAAIRYHLVNKPKLNLDFIPIKNYSFLPLNIYLEGFFDMGYVSNNRKIVSNRLVNQNLYSYGIGLNTLFYNDRVLRFEWSMNSLSENGFYVHFKKAI